MWSTGRRKKDGGHCFPTNPNCWGCIFESVCQRQFLDKEPEKLGIPNKTKPNTKKSSQIKEQRILIEKRKKFAQFVDELKQVGIKGEEFREKTKQWWKQN